MRTADVERAASSTPSSDRTPESLAARFATSSYASYTVCWTSVRVRRRATSSGSTRTAHSPLTVAVAKSGSRRPDHDPAVDLLCDERETLLRQPGLDVDDQLVAVALVALAARNLDADVAVLLDLE